MGSGSSPRFGIEYPLETDGPNVNGDLQTAVDDIDGLLFSLSIISESANYQAALGQLVKMTGANTVTSPAAGANVMWGAYNAGLGTVVTVVPVSGLLNLPENYGTASVTLPNQGDFAVFVCDGTNHNLIAGSAVVLGTTGAPGTTIESYITENVVLSDSASTAVTSVTLSAGTWLIAASVDIEASSGGNYSIWIGPNSASTTGAYKGDARFLSAAGGADADLQLVKSVTLATTTTVYLNVGGSVGAGSTALATSVSLSLPNVTGITAVRTK